MEVKEKTTCGKEMRTLVHAHVFYASLWPELASAIQNISGAMDLYVTLTREDSALRQSILSVFPQAKILLVNNMGWDLLPFLKVLQQVDLQQYDYLVKVHTKRSYPVLIGPHDIPAHVAQPRKDRVYMNGNRWRNLLLRFLRTRDSFEQCIQAFERDSKLGLIADYRLILDRNTDSDTSAYSEACDFMRENGYPIEQFRFIAGTMFIARAKIFIVPQKIQFTDDMFAIPEEHTYRTFAHDMERILGAIVYAQGYEIRDIAPQKSFFYDHFLYWFFKVFAFFFQYRETHSGYRNIKICKIRVWHQKIVKNSK